MTTRVPILTFHALEADRAAIAYPPRLFARLLLEIDARGYRTAPLSEIVDCLERDTPLPPRTLVLTFDDGFRSVHDVALPLLQQHGARATLFLCTGSAAPAGARELPSITGRAMLTWAQVRELQANGFELGAHTGSHPDLTRLAPERVREEMLVSQRVIAEQTGAAASICAYPFGRWNPSVRRCVATLARAACTTDLGLVSDRSDRYRLPRIDACYLRSERLLRLIGSSLLPLYLGLRNGPRALRQRLCGNPAADARSQGER